MEDWDVRDWDVDGDARVEIAAVVFGEGRVGWGEDDRAIDFVAGWHFVLWLGRTLFQCERMVCAEEKMFVVFWKR